MSKFLTGVAMSFMYSADNQPLKNKSGAQLYRLDLPLVYQSDIAGQDITVPTGFVTDLASVPRIPLFYMLLNGIADAPGVVHDFLYSTGHISRSIADKVLYEACIVIGVSKWKAKLIYWGVRLGGSSQYKTVE